MQIELGRHLFYDARLSGNGQQSCASCHQQQRAFSDGRATAVGSTGQRHTLNAMTLTNVAYNLAYTWNGSVTTLERQALVPMLGTHPVELGFRGVRWIRADPRYAAMFRTAFPGERRPISVRNVVRAIAAFERTLISGRSAYDRAVYDAEHAALSSSAWRGMNLFFSARLGCSACHSGFNFSGPVRYAGSREAKPLVTSNGITAGRFRVPTLRNVELTAPYMHDGSIATLGEVVDRYDDARQLNLSSAEKEDLLAFLRSLTDEEFVRDARFAKP